MKTQSPEQNTGRLRFRSAWLALFLLPLGACSLHAQWTGADTGNTTYTNNSYNDPLNWTGGVINGVFTGDNGWTAAYYVGIAGNVTFTDGLTFTYSDNYSLTFQAASSSTTSNVWILDGGVTLNTNTAGTLTGETINLGAASRLYTLDLDGATQTFAINPGTSQGGTKDTLNITGATITDGSILQTGGGTLNFSNNTNVDTTGSIIVQTGSMVLGATANITNAAGVDLYKGSIFEMSALATQDVNTALPINLYGGLFNIANSAAGANTTLGVLTAANGQSVLSVASTTGTLTLAGVVQENSAILNISGLYAGTQPILVTNDANLLSGLVGGGGAAGTTTVSILPWVFAGPTQGNGNAEITDSGYYGARGFVTYTTAGGFRMLTPSEYLTNSFATAGQYDNVLETSETTLTPSGGAGTALTINSLWLAGLPSGTPDIDGGTATYTLSAGTVLTIESGDLLSAGSIAGGNLNPTNTLNGGTIEAGDGQELILNAGRGELNINSQISGDSGVVIASGAGRVFLGNTTNNYSGPTIIDGGLLTTRSEVIPDASPVIVNSGGNLQIGSGTSNMVETIASLSGSGIVNFQSATNRLDIGSLTGVNAGTAGYVTVNSGGFISPGDASGTFQANALTMTTDISGVIFQPGSALYLDLASATSFDSLVFTGTAANAFINGGTLYINLLNGYVPVAGTTFTSIVGTTAGSGSGFDSIVDSSNGADGLTWTLTADGNDWVLTATSAIPEPATCALFLGALALVATGVIRRRKS